VAKYLVAAQIIIFGTGKIKGECPYVIDPSTAHAAQMIVFGRIRIETGLAARVLKFLNQSHPSHQIQVAIDRAQTHSRQPRPDEFVEFSGGWVRSNRLQFFENDLPLASFTVLSYFHRVPCRAGRQQLPHIPCGKGTGGDLKFILLTTTIHIDYYY